MKKYLKFLMLGIAVAAVLEPLQVIAQESIPPIVVTTTRVPNGPPSPVWLPPIVVQPSPEDLPSDNSDNQALKEKPTTEEAFKKLWKKVTNLCKKSTETCSNWGVRIELGYCTEAGTMVSICNLAVYSELEGLNSCKNVTCD